VNLTVSSDNPSDGFLQEGADASASARATAVIRFRIKGVLCFLSHAETARVFERACARAALPVRYSEGFNPHPKLSLPLPRPVGVQADDELLVARLGEGGGRRFADAAGWETALRQALAAQVPDGIEVSAVTLAAANASFQPRSAEYVFPLRAEEIDRLRDRMASVMASSTCVVERTAPERRAARRIDVRPFLRSMRLEGTNLVVEHALGPAGSVRVEEILQLLGLHRQDLAGPVRRTKVIWETIS
jgi:radical SAM-linked protein